MSDSVEKQTLLKAPVSRVWKALTDHEQFGEWFRVKLESPFREGELSHGHITYPGFEYLRWESKTLRIDPERYFSFTWHPYAIDPEADYSQETPTLVEFHLEATDGGTLLTVRESGFDKLPPERRSEAFRMNNKGWGIQMQNIVEYVG
jgi:uncharacterized protein YndB with AHSA1/START domain